MRLGRDVLGRDLYGVLEVSPTATPGEIQRAYRRLVRASHPDLFPGRTPHRMVELNVAASVLLEPSRRAEYDRWHGVRACPCRETPWPPPRQPAARVAYAWAPVTVPPVAPVPDGEAARLVTGLRSAIARGLCTLGWRTALLTPREHLMLTLASVCLAFVLIASARPSSLPGFQKDARERHAWHRSW